MSLVGYLSLLVALPVAVLAGGDPVDIPDNCITTSTCDRIAMTTTRPTITVGLSDSDDGSYCNEYEVVVEEFCPTGLKSVTYTVTQTCTLPVCETSAGPPPGFTTTVSSCDSCGSTPITATLTIPLAPGQPTGDASDPSDPSKPVTISSGLRNQPVTCGLFVAGVAMAMALAQSL